MAHLNETKLANYREESGEYFSTRTSFGAIMKALKNGTLMIPKEQREVKESSRAHKKKAESFIAYVLIHALMTKKVTDDTKALLKATFGEDIEICNGSIQFIGISVDADGYIYLSDGQHRFAYYLKSFFDGTLRIKYGTDFGNDFLNNRITKLMDCVEFDDGDGQKRDGWEFHVGMLSEQQKQAILDMEVVAQSVAAMDAEERAALFIAMNDSIAISNADMYKANYGNESTYVAIDEVKKALDAANEDGVTFPNGKHYNGKDAQILNILFNNSINTLIPYVAHACLLTYLPKTRTKKYQWEYSANQTQVEQVRNFFKATHTMSETECYDMLCKFMDDLLVIAKKVYVNCNNMMLAKGLKSLLVGQTYALRKCGLAKAKFYDLARDITFTMMFDKGYQPENSKKVYQTKDFNNAHYNRRKNELFNQWVIDEYDAMEKEAA